MISRDELNAEVVDLDRIEIVEEIEVNRMHWSTGLLIAVTSFIIGCVAATSMMFLAAHLLLG